MTRLVLFDIDGTLILSGGAGMKAFAKVCTSEFNQPDGASKLQFSGRTDPSIVRQFFESHAIEASAENFQRFFDSYLKTLKSSMEENEGWVLPGIHRLLKDLGAWPEPPAIGLLTGNIRPGARIKLGHYKLWDFFKTGAFGDDHEDRNQVAAVARDRGSDLLGTPLRGEEIVVIGDTPLDIRCAEAIGARCLAVATGNYKRAALEEHRPAWAVESLEKVPADLIMS